MHSTFILLLYCAISILINHSKCDKWINPSDLNAPKYGEEWVDPHDMRPSKEYLKYTNNPSSLHKKQTNPTATASEQLTEIYYKRTINMLLKSVHEDNNEIDTYSGYLYFKINAADYERLRNFAENIENETNLFEINKILEGILTKPSHQHVQEFLETWFHKFLNIAFSRKGIITIISATYIIAVYEMIRAKYNLRYMLTFFLVNIFVYDFIFTWIRLYQKTEIEYMVERMKHDAVPAACDPKTMNAWEFVWNLFKAEDECQKFHQVRYQDIFWKISPGAVLTDIFARTIEQPSSSVGKAFANIMAAIYNNFPFPINILILVIGMIFFCLILMIILSVVFNRNLHFNFLHLLSFSNSAASTTHTNGDRLTDRNVERLLRIAENQQEQIRQQQQIPQKEQQQQEREENRVFVEEIQYVPEVMAIENPVEETEEITSTTDKTEETNENLLPKTSHTNIGAGDS